MLVVASVLMHGTAVMGLAWVGGSFARHRAAPASHNERLKVAVIEKESPKPVEPITSPDKKTVRAVVPKPQLRRLRKAPQPPPDPAKKLPPPKTQRRRIVGLSFESTAVGGKGPAYAVGNTRMGETDRVASEPDLAKTPPPSNRVSQRIPTASVKFDPPEKVRRIVPDYPPELKAQGIEADLVLRVTIAADGAVREVGILKGATEPEFNASAVRAAQREIYRPARRNGTAVEHTIQFAVRFRLTDY
jgi:protein TonB